MSELSKAGNVRPRTFGLHWHFWNLVSALLPSAVLLAVSYKVRESIAKERFEQEQREGKESEPPPVPIEDRVASLEARLAQLEKTKRNHERLLDARRIFQAAEACASEKSAQGRGEERMKALVGRGWLKWWSRKEGKSNG